MKIFITGGLGFVGRHLSAALLQDGHQITAVGRSPNPKSRIEHPSFTYLAADTTKSGDWQKTVAEHNIVINLAGKSIFTYWTKQAKKQIYDSRILTTRNLAESLAGALDITFFSTSAVGYYGDRGDDILTENAPPGDDFLAGIGRDWEHEALKAQTDSIRVVLTRFGIVLGRGGGSMASMIPAFKLFLGGRLGGLSICHEQHDYFRTGQFLCTSTCSQSGIDEDPGPKAQPPGHVANARFYDENTTWGIRQNPALQPAGSSGCVTERRVPFHL
jgi:hypothetical protein